MEKHLSILCFPDPKLQQRSTVVTGDRTDISSLVKKMIATMQRANGVGLAAPQIGLNIQLCIAELPDGPTAFLNPRIVAASSETNEFEEGCLSLPGVFGIVERPRWVDIAFWTLTGERKKQRFENFSARILQHEVDHLQGILIIDRWKKTTQGADEARRLGIPVRV